MYRNDDDRIKRRRMADFDCHCTPACDGFCEKLKEKYG